MWYTVSKWAGVGHVVSLMWRAANLHQGDPPPPHIVIHPVSRTTNANSTHSPTRASMFRSPGYRPCGVMELLVLGHDSRTVHGCSHGVAWGGCFAHHFHEIMAVRKRLENLLRGWAGQLRRSPRTLLRPILQQRCGYECEVLH